MHHGGKLKYWIDKQTRPNADIAKDSGVSVSTLYNYFQMQEIPSNKLKVICKVLGIDYIREFVLEKNTELEQSEVEKLRAENAVLLRENQLLREQVEQLKIIAGLTKRPRKK